MRENAQLRARVAELDIKAFAVGHVLGRAGFAPDDMTNPAKCIEAIMQNAEKLMAERDAARAALAKREAVAANTEPATEDAPAYVTLSEHGAECALNTLVTLSEENERAARVVGPIIADLRIALCRPWKPAKREAVAVPVEVRCETCAHDSLPHFSEPCRSCIREACKGNSCPRWEPLAASQQAAKGEGE